MICLPSKGSRSLSSFLCGCGKLELRTELPACFQTLYPNQWELPQPTKRHNETGQGTENRKNKERGKGDLIRGGRAKDFPNESGLAQRILKVFFHVEFALGVGD